MKDNKYFAKFKEWLSMVYTFVAGNFIFYFQYFSLESVRKFDFVEKVAEFLAEPKQPVFVNFKYCQKVFSYF